jgi:transcriptional regulator with XRE-family HTH domain
MAKAMIRDTIPFDREAFLARQMKRRGFAKAYAERGHEYALLREMLVARAHSGLTQEAVAKRMGTTKSAISRLESAAAHAPSVTTLERYAKAVGHRLEIRLVQQTGHERLPGRAKRSAKEEAVPSRIVQGTEPLTRLQHLLRQVRADYVDNQRQGQMPRDSGELAAFDAELDSLRKFAKTSRISDYDDLMLDSDQVAELDRATKDFDKTLASLKRQLSKKKKARLARQA